MLFKYKAVKNNKLITDQIQAESEEAVLRFLKTSNYFPVWIKRIDIPTTSILNRISFNDLVDFTRQMAIMLNAGLTIIDSLDVLKKQITKRPMLEVIENLDKEIKGGSNLSTALSKYPQYFSSVYIALVKSGEASGKLSDILLKLADNLEKERSFRGKIRAALVYPAFILCAMLVVGFIMVTFVIPQLLSLYKEFKVELPLTTKILIAVSSFTNRFWPLIILGIPILLLLINRYLHTQKGKAALDNFLLNAPVFGQLIKMSVLVDTTRTLSVMIASGVSLLEALDIIADTTSNTIFKRAFLLIKKEVERGVSLGKAMRQTQIFPPILVQMAIVGEQTGHMDETLMRVSLYFEMETDLAVKAATSLIEPMVLVILGIGVGFLVFSVIVPIYNLTASFK